MDEDLVHFIEKAREKQVRYFERYIEHEGTRNIIWTSVPFKEQPIFITKEERAQYESINNKSIADIMEMIDVLIEKNNWPGAAFTNMV